MIDPYVDVTSLIQRLHRTFLETLKFELEGFGVHDINSVQAMLLFNIGDARMSVGELTSRGCYLGSNVSYNATKLVENGYLAHERSVHDRRAVYVHLTDKARSLRDRLNEMHRSHIGMLSLTRITGPDLESVTLILRRLEQFWTDAHLAPQSGQVAA
jgi:DNA-binding MarR family transcriptional regulator